MQRTGSYASLTVPDVEHERIIMRLVLAPTENAPAHVHPLDVLRTLMQVSEEYSHLTGAQKKALVLDAFARIAAGPDGIPGTADDLLPPAVVAGMRAMLESDLAARTIDALCDATVGRLAVNVASNATLLTALLSCVLCRAWRQWWTCCFCCCCCPPSPSASAPAPASTPAPASSFRAPAVTLPVSTATAPDDVTVPLLSSAVTPPPTG